MRYFDIGLIVNKRCVLILKISVFFELAILNFFQKKIFFASFLSKSVQIYTVEWIGRHFAVFFPSFQQIPCYA